MSVPPKPVKRVAAAAMIPSFWEPAGLPTAPRTARQASPWAIGSVHGTFIRWPQRGCRAMQEARRVRSSRFMARMCSQTRTLTARARTRSGSTTCASHRARNVGQGFEGQRLHRLVGTLSGELRMNGAHDCGGMMGFGPVDAGRRRPAFMRVGSAHVRLDVGGRRYRRLDA